MDLTEVKRCVVPSCQAKSRRRNTFSRLPKLGTIKYYQWLKIIGINKLTRKRNYICKIHFTSESFHKTGSIRPKAFPSLFLNSQISKEERKVKENFFIHMNKKLNVSNNQNSFKNMSDSSLAESNNTTDKEDHMNEELNIEKKINDVPEKNCDYLFNKSLIEEVKTYQLLYNKRHRLFSNQNEKEKSWKKIAQKLNTDVEVCKIYWTNLMDDYLSRAKVTNWVFDAIEENEKVWKLYEPLMFLQKYYQPCKRKDIDSSEDIIPDKRPYVMEEKKDVTEKQKETCKENEPEPVLSFKKKLCILQLLDEGTDAADIAKQYNLKQRTIKLLHRNAEYIRTHVASRTILKLQARKIKKMEELLTTWVRDMKNENSPLSPEIIKDKAKCIYNKIILRSQFGKKSKNVDDDLKLFTANDKWFKEWKKKYSEQYDIKLKDPTNYSINDRPIILNSAIQKTLSKEIIKVANYENILTEEEIPIPELDETLEKDPLNCSIKEEQTEVFIFKENDTTKKNELEEHEKLEMYGEKDSKEFDEALIKEVKACKILYDEEFNHYSDNLENTEKNKTWKEIAKKLNKSAEECKIRWRYLKANYLVIAKATNWADYIQGMKNFEYYKSLTFLKEHTQSTANQQLDINSGIPPDLMEKMEEELLTWIFEMKRKKISIDILTMKTKAKALLTELNKNLTNPKDLDLQSSLDSFKWFKDFCKRSSLRIKPLNKEKNNWTRKVVLNYNDKEINNEKEVKDKEDIYISGNFNLEDIKQTEIKDKSAISAIMEDLLSKWVLNRLRRKLLLNMKNIRFMARSLVKELKLNSNDPEIQNQKFSFGKKWLNNFLLDCIARFNDEKDFCIELNKVIDEKEDIQSFDEEIATVNMPTEDIVKKKNSGDNIELFDEEIAIVNIPTEDILKRKIMCDDIESFDEEIAIVNMPTEDIVKTKTICDDIQAFDEEIAIVNIPTEDIIKIESVNDDIQPFDEEISSVNIPIEDTTKVKNIDDDISQMFIKIEDSTIQENLNIPKDSNVMLNDTLLSPKKNNINPNKCTIFNRNQLSTKLDLKEEAEDLLNDWIYDKNRKNILLNDHAIISKARRISLDLRRYNSQRNWKKNWVINNMWFKDFKERNYDIETKTWISSKKTIALPSPILQDEIIIDVENYKMEEKISSSSIEHEEKELEGEKNMEKQDKITIQDRNSLTGKLNYKPLTKNSKFDVIQLLEQGLEPLQVAKKFNISTTTVCQIYSQAKKIISDLIETGFFLEEKRKLLPELIQKMEESLNLWILNMNKIQFHISRTKVQQQAIRIFNQLKYNSNNPDDSKLDFCASIYWYNKYTKRFPVEEDQNNCVIILPSVIQSFQSDYILKMEELLTYWLIDINSKKLKSSKYIIINKAKGILFNFNLKSNDAEDYYKQIILINNMWFETYVKRYGVHFDVKTLNWVCSSKTKEEANLIIDSINNNMNSQSQISINKIDKKHDKEETDDNKEKNSANDFENLISKSKDLSRDDHLKINERNFHMPLKTKLQIIQLMEKGRNLQYIAHKCKLPISAVCKIYINSYKPRNMDNGLLTLSSNKCIRVQCNLLTKMETELTGWIIGSKSVLSENDVKCKAKNIFQELKKNSKNQEDLKEFFIADDNWFKSFQKRSGITKEITNDVIMSSVPSSSIISSKTVTSESSILSSEKCMSAQTDLIIKMETALTDWMTSTESFIGENDVKCQAKNIFEELKKKSKKPEDLKEIFVADEIWFKSFQQRAGFVLEMCTSESATLSPENCFTVQSELLLKMETALTNWMINSKLIISENDVKCQARIIFEELKKNSNKPEDLKEIFVADETWFKSFQKRSGIKKTITDVNSSPLPSTNISSEMVTSESSTLSPEKYMSAPSDLLLKMETILTDWMIGTKSFLSEKDLTSKARSIFEELKKNSNKPEDLKEIFVADETWFKSFQIRSGIKKVITDTNISRVPSTNDSLEMAPTKLSILSAEKCISVPSNLLLKVETALTDWMISKKSLISENDIKGQARNIFEELQKSSNSPEDLKEIFVADETWLKSFQKRSGIKIVITDAAISPLSSTNDLLEMITSNSSILSAEKSLIVPSNLLLQMEKALTVWMISTKSFLSENELKSKARSIFEELKKNSRKPEDLQENFVADETWFESFQKRSGIQKVIADATVSPVLSKKDSSETISSKSSILPPKCINAQSDLLLKMEAALTGWIIGSKSFLSENDVKCQARIIFEDLKKTSSSPEDLKEIFVADETWLKSFQNRFGIKSVITDVIISSVSCTNISSKTITSESSTLSPEKCMSVESDLLLKMEIALTNWMISTKSYISENEIKRQASNIFEDLKKNSNKPEDLKEIFVPDETWFKSFQKRSGIKSVTTDTIISSVPSTSISTEKVTSRSPTLSSAKSMRIQSNLIVKMEIALTDWMISTKSLISENDLKCQAKIIFEKLKKYSNNPEDLKEIFVADETWFKCFQRRSGIRKVITNGIKSPVSTMAISSEMSESSSLSQENNVQSDLLLKMERILTDWLNTMNRICTFISENTVKLKAKDIFEELKVYSNNPEDLKETFIADDTWFKSFRKRSKKNNGKTDVIVSPASNVNISSEIITSESSILSKVQSDLLLKMEMALTNWMMSTKTLITENDVKSQAKDIFEELKKNSNKPEDLNEIFVADENWFKSFQKRTGMTEVITDVIISPVSGVNISSDSSTSLLEKCMGVQPDLLLKMETALTDWMINAITYINENDVKCQARNMFEELKKNSTKPEDLEEIFVADDTWLKSFQKRCGIKIGIADATVSPVSNMNISSESSALSQEKDQSGLLLNVENALTDWLHMMNSTKSFTNENSVKCKAKDIFEELKKNSNKPEDLKEIFIADQIWFEAFQKRFGIKIETNDMIISPEMVTSAIPALSPKECMSVQTDLLLKMEIALTDWLHNMKSTKSFISENSVKCKAKDIFEELKKNSNKPEDLKEIFIADQIWFEAFQKRFGIKIETNDMTISPEMVTSELPALSPKEYMSFPTDLLLKMEIALTDWLHNMNSTKSFITENSVKCKAKDIFEELKKNSNKPEDLKEIFIADQIWLETFQKRFDIKIEPNEMIISPEMVTSALPALSPKEYMSIPTDLLLKMEVALTDWLHNMNSTKSFISENSVKCKAKDIFEELKKNSNKPEDLKEIFIADQIWFEAFQKRFDIKIETTDMIISPEMVTSALPASSPTEYKSIPTDLLLKMETALTDWLHNMNSTKSFISENFVKCKAKDIFEELKKNSNKPEDLKEIFIADQIWFEAFQKRFDIKIETTDMIISPEMVTSALPALSPTEYMSIPTDLLLKMETALTDWLHNMNSTKSFISENSVKCKAKDIFEELKKTSNKPEDLKEIFVADETWFKSFQKRSGIKKVITDAVISPVLCTNDSPKMVKSKSSSLSPEKCMTVQSDLLLRMEAALTDWLHNMIRTKSLISENSVKCKAKDIFEELKNNTNMSEDLKEIVFRDRIWFNDFQKRSGMSEYITTTDVIYSPASEVNFSTEMIKIELLQKMEESLISWIFDMSIKKLPRYKQTTKNKAKSLFYSLQVNSKNVEYSKLRFIAGEVWFNSFVKRHDISEYISEDKPNFTVNFENKMDCSTIVSSTRKQPLSNKELIELFPTEPLNDKVNKSSCNNAKDKNEINMEIKEDANEKEKEKNIVHEIKNLNKIIFIRKKTRRLSLKSKFHIIQLLEKGVPVRLISKKFGITVQTVNDIYRIADKIQESIKSGMAEENTLALKSILIRKVEKLLIPWLHHKMENNIQIPNYQIIQQKAIKLFNNLKQNSKCFKNETFNASYSWFTKFRKRAGINLYVCRSMTAEYINENSSTSSLSNEDVISSTSEDKTSTNSETNDIIDNNKNVDGFEFKEENVKTIEEEKLRLLEEINKYESKVKTSKEVEASNLENERLEIKQENEEKEQGISTEFGGCANEDVHEIENANKIIITNPVQRNNYNSENKSCYNIKKKTRRRISLKLKFNIIQLLDKGVEIPVICKKFGIKRKTVRDICRSADKIRESIKSGVTEETTTVLKSILIRKVEKLLILWIHNKNKNNIQIFNYQIQQKAIKLFNNLKQNSKNFKNETFNASYSWFLKFKKKFGVKLMVCRSMTAESVNTNSSTSSLSNKELISSISGDKTATNTENNDIIDNNKKVDEFEFKEEKNNKTIEEEKLRLLEEINKYESKVKNSKEVEVLKLENERLEIKKENEEKEQKLSKEFDDCASDNVDEIENVNKIIITNPVQRKNYNSENKSYYNIKKETRRRISLKLKFHIIQLLDKGFKVPSISKKFGISERAIHYFYKNADKIRESIKSGVDEESTTASKSILIRKVEKLLVPWIHNKNKNNIQITNYQIRQKAIKLFNNLKQNTKIFKSETFNACYSWFVKFKKQFGLKPYGMVSRSMTAEFLNRNCSTSSFSNKELISSTSGDKTVTNTENNIIDNNKKIDEFEFKEEKNDKTIEEETLRLLEEINKYESTVKNSKKVEASNLEIERLEIKEVNEEKEQALSKELDDCASGDADEMSFKYKLTNVTSPTNSNSSSNCASPTMKLNNTDKRPRNAITLKQKLDIIQLLDKGNKAAHIARQIGLPETTVRTIYKNSDKIRNSIAAGSMLSSEATTKIRSGLMQRMEKLLTAWIFDMNSKNLPISSRIIQEKARSLFNDLKDNSKIPEDLQQTFNASHGWFERFKRRSGLHSLKLLNEVGNIDSEENSWTGALNIKDEPLSNEELISLFGEDVITINDTINCSSNSNSNIEENHNQIKNLDVDDNVEDNESEIPQRIIKDSSDEEEPEPNFPLEKLTDAMKQLDIAMEMFQKYDNDTNRSKSVRLSILESVECYRDLIQEKEKNNLRNNKDSYYKNVPFNKESPIYIGVEETLQNDIEICNVPTE